MGKKDFFVFCSEVCGLDYVLKKELGENNFEYFQPMYIDTVYVTADRKEVKKVFSNGPITPSQLGLKDLPWLIYWDREKCQLCGRCVAACPMRAIELGTFRQRVVETPINNKDAHTSVYKIYYGIKQKKQIQPMHVLDVDCVPLCVQITQ